MRVAKEYKIAIVGGDGIGPEVTEEGMKVLRRAGEIYGFSLNETVYPWSTEHYLETGVSMPDSVFDEYLQQDSVLLGAIGDPRVPVGMLERAIIGGLRWTLDLYINLRPIKLYAEHLCPLKDKAPDQVDMLFVRENTEGLYSGVGGFFKKNTPDEIAVVEGIYTRKGAERAIRYAYEACRARDQKKKLTIITKANAVPAHRLYLRTFEEVGKEYPDIQQDEAYVDAASMWMVKNPEDFDTVITTNMFGDILTDLGAMLQGGMGIAASANIHPGRVSMFEPIHGSMPKAAGKGTASPVAAIAAVWMMLDFLGEKQAAADLENTVADLLRDRRIPKVTSKKDPGDLSTSEVGILVVEELTKRAG